MQIDGLSDTGTMALDYLMLYGPRLIGALLFLAAAWVAASWARRITRRALERASFDRTLTLFFASAARWAVLIMAALASLGLFGIQTTSFAAVLASAGLAIGLAFQGSLAHVASGVMLLLFRPFGVGDTVNAGGVTGEVAEIELFTTNIDTADNRRIVVPNSLIFGGTIENMTYHPTRRVTVAVGTDYGADLQATRAALERAARGVAGALTDPAPEVVLVGLGASSIDWQVRVWAPTPDYFHVQERTTEAIKRALDEAGIAIPFPQMDVHLDRTPVAG